MQGYSRIVGSIVGVATLVSSSTRARAEPVVPSDDTEPRDDIVSANSSDASKDSASGSEGNTTRRTDHVRAGVIGGVGFPRPLAVEGLVELERTVAVGLEYSALPPLTISGIDTSFWALAFDAKVFPFKNAFFLGLRAGRQHLGGHATIDVRRYGSLAESITVDTTFVNPELGLLWTFDPGITLGIDIGVQIPLGASASTSIPSGTTVNRDLMSVADSLGKTPLPTVDLLRIGILL